MPLEHQNEIKTQEYRVCSVSVQCVRLKEEPEDEHEYDSSEASACANTVKEEPGEHAEYSESTVALSLYAGHEIKDELVLGPELLNPPDCAFSQPKAPNVSELILETSHPQESCEDWLQAGTVRRDCLPVSKVKNADSSSSILLTQVLPDNKEPISEKTSRSTESCGCFKNSHPGVGVRACSVKLESLPVYKKNQANSAIFSAGAISQDKNEIGTKPEVCTETYGSMQEQFPQKQSLIPYISHSLKKNKKKRVECEMCLRTFTSFKYLVRHLEIHIGTNINQCKICKKQFLYKGSWVRHMENHKSNQISQNSKLYKCEICFRQFTSFEYLDRHLQTHIGTNIHECKICKKQFLYKERWARHMKKHKSNLISQKDKLYKCEICLKTFQCSFLLQKHTGKHERQAQLKCKYCNKQVAKLSRLIEHERIHTGEKPYKCNICLRGFARRRYAATHFKNCKIKQINSKCKVTSLYKCVICMQMFSSNHNLTNHKRLHTGERPYKCLVCMKQFRSHGSLYIHRKRKHESYTCDACREQFKDKDKLRVHIHCLCESLCCAICGVRCEGRGLLRWHARAHIAPGPESAQTQKQSLAPADLPT